MKKTLKGLLLSLLTAIIIISGIPAYAADSDGVTLRADSALTIDPETGYLHGIWGTITAEKLAAEFSVAVDIESDGDPITGNEYVPSDANVIVGGSFITVVVYGDTNKDGRINLSDVAMMLKHIAKWDMNISLAAADTAVNGKINLADVASLLKWIAGWNVILGNAVFPAMDVKLNGGFKVVVPTGCDSFELEAAVLVSEALDSIYSENQGYNRIISDDEQARREILIGDTSRALSGSAVSELGEHDWCYNIVTDSTVVIAGHDSIATLEAAERFVFELFGYVDDYNKVSSYKKADGSIAYTSTTVRTRTKVVFDYTPDQKEISIGGRNLSEYVIVDKYGNSDAAEFLQHEILKYTGNAPEIVTLKNADDSPAIRLGVGKSNNEFLIGLSADVFAIGLSDDDIVIDVLETADLLDATRAFSDWYIENGMDLEQGEIKYGGIDSNLLRMTEKTDVAIDDGVTYSEIRYVDNNGLPVNAYLVKVENGASRIMMGMPGNGTAITNAKSTVSGAMKAAEADGIDVVAGINADFFNIDSDYSPVGLCVRDGVILKQNTEVKPWIAVMKDGTLDCGIAGEARSKIGNMLNGFGASHVMLKQGIVYQDGVGDSFGMIRHPRSAMGYDGEGNVYLLVVDGRRPTLSNGASLLDLTIMFRDFGAASAVNLDGGGSSAMVIDDGGFKVKNSPSDGAERKVFNSVLITK